MSQFVSQSVPVEFNLNCFAGNFFPLSFRFCEFSLTPLFHSSFAKRVWPNHTISMKIEITPQIKRIISLLHRVRPGVFQVRVTEVPLTKIYNFASCLYFSFLASHAWTNPPPSYTLFIKFDQRFIRTSKWTFLIDLSGIYRSLNLFISIYAYKTRSCPVVRMYLARSPPHLL
jgi:hypothetical protein